MIVVKLMGGMGNQMFQYALARSLSIKYGKQISFDLDFLHDRTPRKNFTFRDYDLDLFNVKANILTSEKTLKFKKYPTTIFGKIKRKLNPISIIKEKVFTFDESILKIKFKNAYIDGYWQNFQYFDSIKEVIEKDFSLKDSLNPEELKLKDEIMNCNSICLNVRRGDFVTNKAVNKVHGAKDYNYYNDGVTKISKLVKNGIVYVFSDDIKWCTENLKFELPTKFITHKYKGNKFGVYLELMKSCNHFVIPNSTFAWWAAYLARNKEKVVIAPKEWFSDSELDSSEIIPNTWIKI